MVMRKPFITLILSGLAAVLLTGPAQSSQEASGMVLGGSRDAPIRMEVFSDFECPGCRYFYQKVVLPVLQDYADKDKVCVIYHEFPLSQHKHAHEAARYCEAAYKIGREKALQVIDALFEHQSAWTRDGDIEKIIAGKLSSEDLAQIRKNLAESGIDRSIRQGIQLGNERKVGGTPTMFLYYLGKTQKVERLENMRYIILKGFFDRIVK